MSLGDQLICALIFILAPYAVGYIGGLLLAVFKSKDKE